MFLLFCVDVFVLVIIMLFFDYMLFFLFRVFNVCVVFLIVDELS